MMRRICAYCRRDMGESMGPDGMITHGICVSCAELSEDERAWEIEKYGRCLTVEERRASADLPFAPQPEEVKRFDEMIAEMNRKPLAVELSEMDDYPFDPDDEKDEEDDPSVCKDTGEPRAFCTCRECCYERDLQEGDRAYDEWCDNKEKEARHG